MSFERRLFLYLALLAGLGLGLIHTIHAWGLDRPDWGIGNAFFALTTAQEPWGLLLTGGVALGAAWGWNRWKPLPASIFPRWTLPLLTFFVLILGRLGWETVFHGHYLAADEFSTQFQALIFAQGKIRAPISSESRELAPAAAPIFVRVHESGNFWASTYLPVYAAIRSVFVRFQAEKWCNPVLSALSVLLISGICHRRWRDDRSLGIWAALLLVSSSQFELYAMSAYSMPAHLTLNLLWLWLYLQGKPGRWIAPWVGVAAMGLHQPFMHALFVTPFLLLEWKHRRWRTALYDALIYGSGGIACILWWNAARGDFQSMSQSILGWPGLQQITVQFLSLERLLAWNTIAFFWLFLMSLTFWKTWEEFDRALLGGVLLTIGFYTIYRWDQGHGWGYRYFHSVLANCVLIAILGLRHLQQSGSLRSDRPLLLLMICGFLLQLPLRCIQAHTYSLPFARAAETIRNLPAKVVIIDHTQIWYGQNLVRNLPELSFSPLILHREYLTSDQRESLRQDPNAYWLSAEEAQRWGLFPLKSRSDPSSFFEKP